MSDLIEVVANVDAARVRRASVGGRSYLVAPMTLIVPGVLAGSRGPLYYPPDEVSRNVGIWDRAPLTLGHPQRDGAYVSANEPGILAATGLGHVRNPRYDGQLRAEGWFDELRTRNLSPETHKALCDGRPFELSTGLVTDNHPAPKGSHHNGVPYNATARNYRRDHVAILHGAAAGVGACSVKDGCGVLVNQAAQWGVLTLNFSTNAKDAGGHGSDKRGGGGLPDMSELLKRMASSPHSITRTAAALSRKADQLGTTSAHLNAGNAHLRATAKHAAAGRHDLAQQHAAMAAYHQQAPVRNARQPSGELDITPEKACRILRDKSIRGKPLTDAQRGMFGARCGERGKTRNLLWHDGTLNCGGEGSGVPGPCPASGKKGKQPTHLQAAQLHDLAAAAHSRAAAVMGGKATLEAASASTKARSVTDKLAPAGSDLAKKAQSASYSSYQAQQSKKSSENARGPQQAQSAAKSWKAHHEQAAAGHQELAEAHNKASMTTNCGGAGGTPGPCPLRVDKIRHNLPTKLTSHEHRIVRAMLPDQRKAVEAALRPGAADEHVHAAIGHIERRRQTLLSGSAGAGHGDLPGYAGLSLKLRSKLKEPWVKVLGTTSNELDGLLSNCGGAGGTMGPCPAHEGGAHGRAIEAHAASMAARRLSQATNVKERQGRWKGYNHNLAATAARGAVDSARRGNLRVALAAHETAAYKHGLAAGEHEVASLSTGATADDMNWQLGHKQARYAHLKAKQLHDNAAATLRGIGIGSRRPPDSSTMVSRTGNHTGNARLLWSHAMSNDAQPQVPGTVADDHADEMCQIDSGVCVNCGGVGGTMGPCPSGGKKTYGVLATTAAYHTTQAKQKSVIAQKTDTAETHRKAADAHEQASDSHRAAELAAHAAGLGAKVDHHRVMADKHQQAANDHGLRSHTHNDTALPTVSVKRSIWNKLGALLGITGGGNDVANADESLEERLTEVRDAFRDAHAKPMYDPYTGERMGDVPQCYLRAVYDDHVIYDEDGELYRQTYADDEEMEQITFGTPEPVEIEYVPSGGGGVDNHLTDNAWSDAARQAAAEARKNKGKTSALAHASSEKADELSKVAHAKGTADAHEKAQYAHEAASGHHATAGDVMSHGKGQSIPAGAALHYKAANAHDKAANEHYQLRMAAGTRNQTTTANADGGDDGRTTSPSLDGATDMNLTADRKKEIVANLTANCSCNGHDMPWKGQTAEQLGALSDGELAAYDRVRAASAANATQTNNEALVKDIVAAVGKAYGLAPVTTNAAGQAEAPTMAYDDWMRRAPAQIRESVALAEEAVHNHKVELVQQLVANIADDAKRQERGKKMLTMTLNELKELVELLPRPAAPAPAPQFQHRSAMNWAGAAGGPPQVGLPTAQEPVPEPVYNFAEWAGKGGKKAAAVA